MSEANASDADRHAQPGDDARRAAAPGLKRVVGLLSLAVAVLFALFLLQAYIAGQRERATASATLVGTSFATFGEFIARLNDDGYVFLGRFDDAWPAKVFDERTARNEIEFERADGTRHRYPGFDGYRLKVVKLSTDDGKESVIVLRSKEKQ